MLIKGIISFPTLFTAKVPQAGGDAKYGVTVLLPPNDPQLAAIQAEVDAAKQNTFPSGIPNNANVCFAPYDVKYAGKDYYDPRFTGWHIFTCSAKQEDKPSVVDGNYNQIIDPGQVYSGMVAYVNAGISGYIKGTGGVGGWLNGVMLTAEEPPMGRLDNKPSVEQMFAGVGAAPGQPAPPATNPLVAPASAPPATNPLVAPASAPPPTAVAAPAPVALQMTANANGATYESMIAAGWTDEMLLAQGMAKKPSFAYPFPSPS